MRGTECGAAAQYGDARRRVHGRVRHRQDGGTLRPHGSGAAKPAAQNLNPRRVIDNSRCARRLMHRRQGGKFRRSGRLR